MGAASDDVLPKQLEPMHVFYTPALKIKLSKNVWYAVVYSTANGAPTDGIPDGISNSYDK